MHVNEMQRNQIPNATILLFSLFNRIVRILLFHTLLENTIMNGRPISLEESKVYP